MSMTNAEKYKTAEERYKAHMAWCQKSNECRRDYEVPCCNCAFKWLELEAEEGEPMPCLYCGGNTEVVIDECGCYCVSCIHCEYGSPAYNKREWAIDAHNRKYKAIKAYEESEAKRND